MNTCRLCFKANCKYELLDKTMLKFFHIQTLDLSHAEAPTVCIICVKKVKCAIDFKTNCLKKENSILFSKKILQLDKSDSVNLDVCRLCKDSVNINFAVSLLEILEQDKMIKTFQKYLPEINLEATQNPLICESCQTTLNNFNSFAILPGINAEYDKNKSVDQFMDTEIGRVKVKSEIVEYIANSESKMKEEMVNEDNIYMVNVGSEIDDDIDIFIDKTTNLKLKEDNLNKNFDVIEIKREIESNAIKEEDMKEDVRNQHEYAELKFKTEEIFIKSKIEAYLSEGNDTEEILSQNTIEQDTIMCHYNIGDSKCTIIKSKAEQCLFKTKQTHETHRFFEETEMYKCRQCSYKTEFRYSLKKHMLIHKNTHGVALHNCQQCTFQTKLKSFLKQHMLIHKKSDELDKFRCQQCTYKTKLKYNLKQHMLIHKNSDEIEMYKCQQCNYESKYKCSLKAHMLIHKNCDEVEMFKCYQCSYQTKSKDRIKRHMVIHKNCDEIEMRKCDQCAFQTKFSRSLKSHMLLHKNTDEIAMHNCQQCKYQTKFKNNLNKHILVHKSYDEVELFRCQQCSFKTKYKVSLRNHLLIHKKEFLN